LSIEFHKSKVLAQVKGSEVEPYQVSLSLDIFSDEEWNYVIETMSHKSLFAAKLLAGEMPQNIEDVFTSNGLSLFPFTLNDIHSQCSCPDPAVPCKHIGAIYYQLSDRLSEDPFVLFELRGRSRERIIQDLRKLRSQKKLVNPSVHRKNNQVENFPKLNTNPNPNQISDNQINYFWEYNDPLESSLVVISPNMGETVLDILGNIPLPKDEENTVHVLDSSSDLTMKHLQNIYRDVTQKACLLAMNMG
jgi:uncharacterized Zn finger protein